jgi:hypothetical protein
VRALAFEQDGGAELSASEPPQRDTPSVFGSAGLLLPAKGGPIAAVAMLAGGFRRGIRGRQCCPAAQDLTLGRFVEVASTAFAIVAEARQAD